MKRLIIADIKSYNNNGKSTGHYYAVAQNYLDLFSDICDVKVAGGLIYQNKFSKNQLFALPNETGPNNSFFINKLNIIKNAYYLFHNTKYEDVIIMQKSGSITMFITIALFASKKRNKIYFIEYDTESINSKIKQIIYSIAKKKIRGIICPNKMVGNAYKIPYCVVTDYIYYKQNQVRLNFSEKIYDFCVIGSIWPDKGVIEVADFFKNTNYKLIIAGKPCDNTIKNRLLSIAKECSNIKLHLDYISEDEYYKYIRESKYSILNYKGCYNERSSGVVFDMIFNGTPIIGHRCNAFKFIEDENLGILYKDIENIDLSKILKIDIYNSYINNIDDYLYKQAEYRDKLFNFLSK